MQLRASGSSTALANMPVSALSRPMHLTAGSAPLRRATRPWRVLHTCESIGDVRGIIEGELSVGMRPMLITPDGYVIAADAYLRAIPQPPPRISLMNAWHDVRNWRKLILDADPHSDADVVHAHSFAAGMAGVRNCPAVVYEITSFIEDYAPADESGSWLTRSFRVAEQFVISRAAAVVTRSESVRQAVLRRGAAMENTFVIPKAIIADDWLVVEPDWLWLRSMGIDRERQVLCFAPLNNHSAEAVDVVADLHHTIDAFAAALPQAAGAHLLVEVPESSRHIFNQLATNAREHITAISPNDAERAMQAAHVVITGAVTRPTSTPQTNPIAERALLLGKALLAADAPENRDVCPSGRGCLWFTEGDGRDLARRIGFLVANSDFRAALAESGRSMMLDTREPEAIAMEYDQVYKHAAARRRSGGLQTPAITLNPAQVML